MTLLLSLLDNFPVFQVMFWRSYISENYLIRSIKSDITTRRESLSFNCSMICSTTVSNTHLQSLHERQLVRQSGEFVVPDREAPDRVTARQEVWQLCEEVTVQVQGLQAA